MNRQVLERLHETLEMKELVKELDKTRPIVPRYDYKIDNSKEVCANMLIQQGYDLAVRVITPWKEYK